jgi:hypothetical protein
VSGTRDLERVFTVEATPVKFGRDDLGAILRASMANW